MEYKIKVKIEVRQTQSKSNVIRLKFEALPKFQIIIGLH